MHSLKRDERVPKWFGFFESLATNLKHSLLKNTPFLRTMPSLVHSLQLLQVSKLNHRRLQKWNIITFLLCINIKGLYINAYYHCLPP